MAIAAGLCGLGQGRAVASAVDAMARQPGAAARIQTAMIIGLALIESLAIYTLVIALIRLFVKGINFARCHSRRAHWAGRRPRGGARPAFHATALCLPTPADPRHDDPSS